MKKRAVIIGAGIALFALFQIAGGLIASSGFFADGRFGCDLQLRRNEICCAHQGVNSFRIWTRETTLSGFTPITRPDMENLPRAPGDAVVHAYPPWHTAMFYFYGWLPEQMCLSLMSVVFGLCLFFILSECVRISKAHFEHYGLAVGLSLAIFFMLTGLATWALRRNREFIVSCVPVVVVIPLWTYGQEHDHVILVIALLVLAGRMFAVRKFDKWAVLGIVYFLSILFIHLWRMAVHFHLFDPTGLSKIYSLVELASQMSLVAVAALLIREELLRRHRGTVELHSSPLSF